MMNLRRDAALCIGIGLSLFMTACGGGGGGTTTPPPPTTHVLTVNSTAPASGVAITASPAALNSKTSGSTGFTLSYDAGTSVTLTAPATSSGNTFSSWTGCSTASTVTCTVTLNADTTVTANYTVPVAYTLTVNSTTPASGVAITASPADNTSKTSGSTGFTLSYNAGTAVTLTAPATSSGNNFSSWTGCTSTNGATCTVTLNSNTTVTANYAAVYVLTVNSTTPASGVAITASPADLSSKTTGSTAFTLSYAAGSSVTLTAPATSGSNAFSSWSGCTTASTVTCSVTLNTSTTVTANYTVPGKIAPTVTVTPAASLVGTTQALSVTVAVSGGASNPTPTGSVVLTSGTYTSAAATLSSGSAQITIPAGSLAVGSDTLQGSYTPDSASSATYLTATGTSGSITVAAPSTVTVNESVTGPAVTDQLLGMNMAVWNNTALSAAVSPFQAAGIKAVRWPGGSTSDDYHWEGASNNPSNPSLCPIGSYNFPNDTFADFVTDLAVPAGLDIALTADYGTNAACTGPGDPAEAAAWVANALTLGVTVSHMTVGNEEYGSWETDNHTLKNNGATYAAAVAGTSGYYHLIKAASPNTQVGVDVEPSYAPWDQDVLSGAPYDFVEYHYYPETPGSESDTIITQQAAQQLTTNINTIRSELTKWGKPGTPIYVGEIGGPYSNPGKQSWSITQGLFAGQVLGEMMNDGISRLTWWIGFGNCNGTGSPSGSANLSASLYGWQDFGAYNVFSDGPSDTTCLGAGPLGTLSPTARAFQLFSNVAVDGENALTATVTGDKTDVRAYAATHSGGTALVLFNLNQTTNQLVTVTLSGQSASTGVTVETYNKALYDLSGSPTGFFPDPVGTSTWAPPTTTSLGAQSLPLTLTLTPWSMNVVIIR